MQIPPAGIIEIALGDLGRDQSHLAKEKAELESVSGDLSDSYIHGYQLGLQVARAMLRQNTLLQLKEIEAGDLL